MKPFETSNHLDAGECYHCDHQETSFRSLSLTLTYTLSWWNRIQNHQKQSQSHEGVKWFPNANQTRYFTERICLHWRLLSVLPHEQWHLKTAAQQNFCPIASRMVRTKKRDEKRRSEKWAMDINGSCKKKLYIIYIAHIYQQLAQPCYENSEPPVHVKVDTSIATDFNSTSLQYQLQLLQQQHFCIDRFGIQFCLDRLTRCVHISQKVAKDHVKPAKFIWNENWNHKKN